MTRARSADLDRTPSANLNRARSAVATAPEFRARGIPSGALSGWGARLRDWRPPIGRREFWLVQLLVLVIALGHFLLEALTLDDEHGALAYVPTSLFLVPVVYAALNFGLKGSLPTALWGAFLTIPNVVLFHTGSDRFGEIWQLGVVLMVAAFVGHRVDREKRARREAEEREEARRVSEEKYRGLFDHVVEPILVLGPDCEIEHVNQAAARLFARPLEELKGRQVCELVDIDAERLVSGSIRPGEIQRLTADDGRPMWVQPVVIPLVDTDGERRFQLMLRDLTAEYQRQRELEAYAKMTAAAREEERGRIARELHDGPVQSLVLIWRRLDDLGSLDDERRDTELKAAQGAVRDAADELRKVSRELRPSVLDDLGLAAALRAEVATFRRRSGIVARLTVVGTERRLPSDHELALLRIAQEALRNVARHSEARRAVVRLHYEPARVNLSVTDDGRGIGERPVADLLAEGKLGLIGMREQARSIGGEISIGPGRQRGTTAAVTVATQTN